MQAANEYLATHTLDGSAHNLQQIEVPQQISSLGEWNEWVTEMQQMINDHYSG